MQETNSVKYRINLGFEEIRLPPFEDILIIGKRSPHGRIGLSRSFQFLVPNEFETFDVEDPVVEAVFINKRLLKKMNQDRILSILKDKVFPYISEGEIIKVDFKVRLFWESIEQEV
ncbi:MAG: hypothetical protein AB7D05_02060 [Mangrovibacterium sp.]